MEDERMDVFDKPSLRPGLLITGALIFVLFILGGFVAWLCGSWLCGLVRGCV